MSDQSQEQPGGLGKWPIVVAVAMAVWLWRGTPRSFDDLRKFGLNLLIAGLIALTGYIVSQAVFRELTTMEAFAIPKSWEAQGYSGAIVLQRTIDHVNHINATAKTRVARVSVSNERQYASLANLQVPSSGLSVHTLISVLRELFGNDEKIGGEIIEKRQAAGSPSHEYELLLRFDIERDRSNRLGRPSDSRRFVVRMKVPADGKGDASGDVDRVIVLAAETIVERTNPMVMASYLHSARQWSRLDALLDQLVVASRRSDIQRSALILRGARLVDRGRPGEALPYLEKAANEDPLSRFARIRYGEALVKAGRPDDAITQFKWALLLSTKTKPGSLLAASWALALQAKNDLPGAYGKLEEVDEDDRDDARMHRIHGDLLLAEKRFDEALAKYRSALDRAPRDWREYNALGIGLHQSGDLVTAIETFDRAIEADKRVPEPRVHKGKVLFERNDIDGAIAAYREATKADAEYAPAYLEWAECLMRKGDFAGALEPLRIAMTLNPKNLGRLLSELYLVLTTHEDQPPKPVQLSRTD